MSRRAFTLIELLIVIALIAILTVAGFLGYRLQLAKGYDTVRKTDLKALKTSFENYYSDQGCYPTPDLISDCDGSQLQPYIEKIPCDPQGGLPYELILDTQSCAQKFYLFANLANPADPLIVCGTRYGTSSDNVTQAELETKCNQ